MRKNISESPRIESSKPLFFSGIGFSYDFRVGFILLSALPVSPHGIRSIWANIKGKMAALSSNPDRSTPGRRLLLMFKTCGKRGSRLGYFLCSPRYAVSGPELSKKYD
jgi:hypothetical protein